MGMQAASLIGREDELGAVHAFLGSVERGPSALVLSGEAGIGKTVLWEHGIREADEDVGRVLTCRGVEAEASLSFAALSDLLSEALVETMPSLAPPRRRALEIALLLVDPGDQPPDAHAVGLAVLDLLRLLAEHGPVVVALDDAQWLDAASAGVLLIALRRLRDERVGLFATLRTASNGGTAFSLDRAFANDRSKHISLSPLSLAAIHALLRVRIGLELARPELARVYEATAGNPFFALELGRELVRTGTRPTAGQALRVPDSLHQLLDGRLARLPGETLDILLEVAALARPTVETVTAAHGDEERVRRGLETAVKEGVITLDRSQIRFVHPLLASICYEEAPIWKRRAVHQALATAVAESEESARHRALAATGPDAGVADELAEAAEQAAGRGATASAAQLSEYAAELTPDDPRLARARLLRAAELHRLAGDFDRAEALLDQLLEHVPAGVERADVLFQLALPIRTDPAIAVRRCDEALAEAIGDDARSARILGQRGGMKLLHGDVRGGLADSRAALEKAERVGDPRLLAQSISNVGVAESRTAMPTAGLLERGVEIEERLNLALEYYVSPRFGLARLLLRRGQIDRPRTMLTAIEAEVTGRGDENSRGQVLWALSWLEWLAGNWERARGHSLAAYELAEQTHAIHGRLWAGRMKALIEADLGLVDEAQATARETLAISEATANDFYTIASSSVLGRIELMTGNLEAAGRQLRDLPERLLEQGADDPDAPVWADTIETLAALGELVQARTYLDVFEAKAAQLESPLSLERGRRCRALLSAAEGDLDAALVALGPELTKPAALEWPLERGRTLLCLGMLRRQAQQKRGAREALEQALAIFEQLGARLWSEKARAELRRISGRRAPTEELTETEERVALLAAQGRTNKEIAAELYMGLSTVEAHLSRVYQKLGVRRAGLATRLAAAREDVTNTMVDATQP
jgi:DNA-binding CsgD family transcriptional regulator